MSHRGGRRSQTELEIQEFLADLRKMGRIQAEVTVVDRRSGERRKMLSFDFDKRDLVEIKYSGDVPQSPEEEDQNTWVFSFIQPEGSPSENQTPTEGEDEVRNGTGSAEKIEEQLGEELRAAEPTAEDYLTDCSVEFSALSPAEALRVLQFRMSTLKRVWDLIGK